MHMIITLACFRLHPSSSSLPDNVEPPDEQLAVLHIPKNLNQMSSVSRKLSLHASALSDDEYQLYTTSLLSIVSVEDDGGVSQSHNMDDAYYENMIINVRETRAWLRGRYSHLPSLIIDKVSRWFILPCPSIDPTS
jgi:hypothetical protein